MRAEILGDWSPILGDLHRGWQPASPATQSADTRLRAAPATAQERQCLETERRRENPWRGFCLFSMPILSDGLGVYCGVADGARGCYVGGVVCGALVAWDGCAAVPWLSWLYIVRGLQVLSRTGSAPPPSAAPAGGPEASFTSSGHAGCHAGATWTADLRAGRAGRSRVAGVGRPVAAAWPRSRVDDPAPSEMHL